MRDLGPDAAVADVERAFLEDMIGHHMMAVHESQTLLANGLAEELEHRRTELQPEWETRLQCLEGCLAQLPDAQRSLVEGYYFRRDGVEALATESGRSVGASYKMLQRIRHSLQACIESTVSAEGTTA